MANERLTLQIDGKATGTAEIEKLAGALNKVVDISSRMKQQAASSGGGEAKTGFESFPAQIKSLVQDPLSSAEGAVSSFASKFGAIGVAVAGSIGAFGAMVGASFSAARALANVGVQYEAVSIRTGLTTKEIAQFGFAARETESDISVFENSMRKLSEGLTDGGAAGKKTRDALDELGVKTRGLNGQLLPMSQIFRQISTGLNGVSDPAKRAALAVEALGRAGIESLPVFLKLNDALAHAEELNIVGPSGDQLKKFNQYDDMLDDLEEHWKRVKLRFQEGITGTVVLQGAEMVLKILDHIQGSGSPKGEGIFDHFLDFPGISGAGKPSTGNSFDYLRDLSGIDLSRMPKQEDIPLHFPGALFGMQKGQFYTDPIGRINASVAAGSALAAGDKSAFEYTLTGAQASATTAREKANKARLAYFDSAGSATADQVEKLRGAWQAAEKSAVMYENRIKAINAGDSLKRHFEDVMRGLGGTRADDPQAALRAKRDAALADLNDPKNRAIMSGKQYDLSHEQIMLGFQQGKANIEKQLAEEGEKAFIGMVEMTQKTFHEAGEQLELAIKDGLGALGAVFTAIQTSPDLILGGVLPMASKTFTAGKGPAPQRTSQDLVRDYQAQAEAQLRMTEITARPGDEVSTQQKISDIKVDAAEKEFNAYRSLAAAKAISEQELFDARVNYERTIFTISSENSNRLAELRKQQADRQVEAVTGFARAALGGGQGIASFGKNMLANTGETVLSNFLKSNQGALNSFFPKAQEGTALGNLFKGTLFGPDANKSSVTLVTAGTSLQKAALDLTAAASSLANGGGVGLNYGTGGGSSGDGSGFSFGSLLSPGMGLGLASGGLSAIAPLLSRDQSFSGLSGVLGGFKHTGDLQGIFTGVSSGPNGAGSLSTSERVGAGIGTAGAVLAGGEAAYSGFKKGGGRGTLQGISAVAGTAAVLDPEPISKAVLAGVALVTGFVGSMLGDPKQMRQQFIDKALGNAKYEAPVAMNVSMGVNGGYSDYNAWGGVRSSNLSPYPGGVTQPSQWYTGGRYVPIPGGADTPYGGGTTIVHVHGDVIDPQQFFDRNDIALGNTMARNFGTHTELAMAATRATVGG